MANWKTKLKKSKLKIRQIKALNKSISYWKKIVKGKRRSDGSETCPLCKEFLILPRVGGLTCSNCPVALMGYENCDNTPYDDFISHSIDGWVGCKKTKKHAKREVKFLKKIRKKL